MKKFKFNIEEDLFSLLPKYKVGALLLDNLKVKETYQDSNIENYINNVVAEITKRDQYINRSNTYKYWTKAFQMIGEDITENQPSHLALAKRVIKNKQLNRINRIVDLYNIISLHHLLPLGGHDISNINNISIVRSKGVESIQIMNTDQVDTCPKDEFVYIDSEKNRILTRKLVWRQSDYSKVTPTTNSLFIPFDDPEELFTKDVLNQIVSELLGIFNEFYDFEFEYAIVDKYNPIIEFGTNKYFPNVLTPLSPKLIASKSLVNTNTEAINQFFDRKLDQIYPTYDDFKKALSRGKRLRFYMGADCSAPRLHIGHMIPFMKMAELQKLGHQIIFLIGDFTGRIGDPTDKTTARTQLTPEQVAQNAAEFVSQVSKIIDFSDPINPALIVFNSQWNEPLDFQDIIELSTNFTVQQMLERDMFEKRMKDNKPIYLHEFFYPLMQGYDSVYLEVDGEFGGMDQTFNMLAGRQMLKSIKGMEKFVITVKTLLSADGVTKMSKSIGNCIFLTDSPQDKYGKIMAIPDNLMVHYFQLITNYSDQDITNIEMNLHSEKVDPMEIKKELAYYLVKSLDGENAANLAQEFFTKTIQEGEAPSDTPTYSKSKLLQQFGHEINIKDLLVSTQLVISNAEAKRLILSGAVEIEHTKITKLDHNILLNEISIIKCGKRKWLKLID